MDLKPFLFEIRLSFFLNFSTTPVFVLGVFALCSLEKTFEVEFDFKVVSEGSIVNVSSRGVDGVLFKFNGSGTGEFEWGLFKVEVYFGIDASEGPITKVCSLAKFSSKRTGEGLFELFLELPECCRSSFILNSDLF